jgi:2-keto-3-deoxy-6-phosphogluconate aldolase
MTVSPLPHAIVPVVVLDDDRGAEPLADALTKGGIRCAEITFRTAVAPSAILAIGASWMVGRADIRGGRFDRITRASRAAVTALGLDEASAGVRT